MLRAPGWFDTPLTHHGTTPPDTFPAKAQVNHLHWAPPTWENASPYA